MSSIEKLKAERNEVREILEDKDFKNVNRIFNLINADEKLIDDLCKENKRLLESCEGATMMYKDLCESKEIIKILLALYFSPIVTQDDLKKQDEIIKQAQDFIKG